MKPGLRFIKFPIGVKAFGVRTSWLLGAVFRLLLLGTLWNAGLRVRESRAESAAFSEYEYKAGFLFHFLQFIKWPPAPGTPMTIGILGDDPFGGTLDKLIKGESVAGRKLTIKRSRKVEELKGCQVVFVANSEKGNIGAILGGLAGGNILTVGEQEGFVKQGGAIGFTNEGGKVLFEINTGAVQRAGLDISSRVLKLASKVGSW